MTRDTVATQINVLFSPEQGGGFYAKSPDLPGLSVFGATQDELFARVEQAIVLLYKLNHGLTVTVIRAADPATMRPAKPSVSNHYVVAQESLAA